MPVVKRSAESVPLLPLVGLLVTLLLPLFQARVELVSSAYDGIFLMFDNLEDQGLELLCPPNYVELRDLFLWRYYFLCPKFLHVALVEPDGATFDFLCVVRCCSLVIFWVLG